MVSAELPTSTKTLTEEGFKRARGSREFEGFYDYFEEKMAAVLPARPACDSSPATPGAQSIKARKNIHLANDGNIVHLCLRCFFAVASRALC